MEKCKYWIPGERKDASGFDGAPEGYFLKLGTEGGETVAFVRSKDGSILRTFPDYVKVSQSPYTDLMHSVLKIVERGVARSKWPALEADIVKAFEEAAE